MIKDEEVPAMAQDVEAFSLEGWGVASHVSDARGERVIAAVQNAMRLVDALSRLDEARVSDLARDLGLNKAAVDRLLSTLLATGHVEQNAESKRYRLSIRFVAIANGLRSRTTLADLARPRMRELAERFHETVNLGVLSNGGVYYVESIPSRQLFRIEAQPGTILPAYCTGLGKAILSHLSPDDLDDYLRQVVPVRYTQFTVTDFGKLRQQLEIGRKQGYSTDIGEILEEASCLAAPVLDAEGRPVAALSVTAPRSVFITMQNELSEAVREASVAVSAAVAAIGSPTSRS